MPGRFSMAEGRFLYLWLNAIRAGASHRAYGAWLPCSRWPTRNMGACPGPGFLGRPAIALCRASLADCRRDCKSRFESLTFIAAVVFSDTRRLLPPASPAARASHICNNPNWAEEPCANGPRQGSRGILSGPIAGKIADARLARRRWGVAILTARTWPATAPFKRRGAYGAPLP